MHDRWGLYPMKHYPEAFKLGQLKKKGRPRQYIVWVNGGAPNSFPTKAERREFILSTQVLLEANDE